jgi:transposase
MSSTAITPLPTTDQPTPASIFASLELSRSRWLVTVMLPGGGRMSKYSVQGGDAAALLSLLSRLRARAERRVGSPVGIVTVQEAGFDGFWIHRVPQANGIESHVGEAASIAVPRRHRRAKTDAIDGEALLRTLMAFKRGEPRVCSMVVPPSPEAEDRRRERQLLRSVLRRDGDGAPPSGPGFRNSGRQDQTGVPGVLKASNDGRGEGQSTTLARCR